MNLHGQKHIVNILNVWPFPSNTAMEEYTDWGSWTVLILDVDSRIRESSLHFPVTHLENPVH